MTRPVSTHTFKDFHHVAVPTEGTEITELQDELSIRKKNAQILVSRNEELRKQNAAMGDLIEELKEENKELLRSISEYGSNLDEFKLQHQSTRALMSQYVFDLAQVKQKLSIAESAQKLQRKRVKQLEAEKKSLNNQNRALDQALLSTRQEIAEAFQHQKKRSIFSELFNS